MKLGDSRRIIVDVSDLRLAIDKETVLDPWDYEQFTRGWAQRHGHLVKVEVLELNSGNPVWTLAYWDVPSEHELAAHCQGKNAHTLTWREKRRRKRQIPVAVAKSCKAGCNG